jgi:hypothetical protein
MTRVSVGTVTLRSSQISVEVDVARGAKITSLRSLPSEREWLLQSPTPTGEEPCYGSVFTDIPLSGWDEMLPTVDACSYPGGGVELPDHGEAWSRPWRLVEQTSTSLTCAIDGVALDYHFRRRIRLDGPRLSMSYRLSTQRPDGLAALWAPHPQFRALPGTMLQLPGDVNRLDSRADGDTGAFRQVDIGSGGLDWRQVVPAGTGLMLYAEPDVRVSSAVLSDPDGSWLRMAWDSDAAPYFAVWMDHGRYAAEPVVCPEPMTGYYDSVELAERQGRVLRVPPTGPAEWNLEVTVGRDGLQ